MAHDESPLGPSGPQPGGELEKVSVSWLILQRLSDLKEDLAAVKAEQAALRADLEQRFAALERRIEGVERRFEHVDARFDAMDRRWSWSLGLVLVMALGLLAKLLVPGA